MLYLEIEQLKTYLSLGNTLEQWLGHERKDEYTVLKWLSIEKERSGEYAVSYIESFDEGSLEFIDIYEFSTLDPDEPFGVTNTFSSVDKALDFAKKEYNASLDKYVTGGMIQEEYLHYLHSNRQL